MNNTSIININELMDILKDGTSTLLESPFNISVNDFYAEEFDNLDKLIANAKKIILFRHVGADQDAIAAVASMKVLIDKKYPKKEVIISKEKQNFANLTQEDLVIIMDVGDAHRIAGSYFGEPKTARIDHHKTGMMCDVTIEDVNAGSTAELLTLFYNQKDYPLDKKVCELLFKGIISDTGRMQYSLSPSTIAALGILQSYQIDYKNIYNQMYSKSPASIKARKYILNNFLTTEHGVAYLFIDNKKAMEAGVNINDVTSMPYELENMEGHPIWMIAAQRKDGIYIRLRSRGIDIRELAKKYNGGGHAEACGIKLHSRKELTKLIDDCDALLVKKAVIVESDNINESYLTKDDAEINLDKFPDENHVLYITGLSGSGKTTKAKELSKEYNCGFIELDIFWMIAQKTKEESIKRMKARSWCGSEEVDRYIVNYLEQLPESNFNFIKKDAKLDNIVKEYTNTVVEICKNFIESLEKDISSFKIQKVIVEGMWLIYLDPEFFNNKSIIIKGTGLFKSNMRVIHRTFNKKNYNMKIKLKVLFSRLKSCISGPSFDVSKKLDNFKNELITEADNMTEEKEDYLVKYDQYLESHIGCVQQAYQYIKDNIPEILNDVEDLASLDEQIAKHDESKYSEEEYEPYALYFNVSKEKYIDDFNRAWNHHQKTNPHHWQYWVLIEDEEDEKYIPIEIPYNYIIEMICDWWAFSFKKNDLSEILSWYEDHKDKMIINPESKKQIENILNKIRSILQPEAIKEDVLIEKQYKTFADGGRICPYCGEVLDPGEHHKCEPKKEKPDTKPSNTTQPTKNKPEQKNISHPVRNIKPGDPDDKDYALEELDDERTHKNYLHESKIPTKTKQMIYKLNTQIKNKYGTAVASYVMAEVNKGNLEDLDDVQRKLQMLKANGGIDPRTGKKIPMRPQPKAINEDGHLSKDMTVEDIAKKHNVSVEELEKQVKMGIEVEHEHTSDNEEAKRIALDHLFEIPDYYTRLKKMEEEGEAALNESVTSFLIAAGVALSMLTITAIRAIIALKHIDAEDKARAKIIDKYSNVVDNDISCMDMMKFIGENGTHEEKNTAKLYAEVIYQCVTEDKDAYKIILKRIKSSGIAKKDAKEQAQKELERLKNDQYIRKDSKYSATYNSKGIKTLYDSENTLSIAFRGLSNIYKDVKKRVEKNKSLKENYDGYKEWTKMTQEERESAKKNGDLFTLKGQLHTISPDGHARPIESKPVKTKINEDSLLDNAEILTEGWRGLIRKIIKGDSKHRWIDTSNADRADLEIAYNESYNYLKKILVKLKSLDIKKLNNVTTDNYDNAKKALDTGIAQIESIMESSKKIYKTHNVENMRKAVNLLDLYIMKLVPQSVGNNIRFYDPSKGQSAKDVMTDLRESVLDPINKERCPEIFKDNKMISSVRKFIIDIINDFKKQVNFDFKVKNIYMIGSSTGFQYSLTSDIDIELETSIKKSQMKDIIKIIPKGTLLPGTNKPINIFVITDDDSYDFKQAENVYDLVKDKWLKQSEKSDYHVPYQYIKDLSQFFMNGCDLTLSKFEQDKKEMEEYLSLDPKTQEISDNEKAEAISRKIIDLKNDIDALTMAHHVVFAFEKEGYENMPFRVRIEMEKNTDPRYSINNLVYKMVDRFGYFEKINNAKKEATELVKKAEKYGTNK